MIYILVGLFVILGSYVVVLLTDLRRMNTQIQYIIQNETNAELISTIKTPSVKHLLDSNNKLLQQNKKYFMEQRRKEKELHELLTNLTHDLKTPLTVSSGYVQMLKKAETDTEKEMMLKKIDASLQSIRYYLNYLMEFNLIQEKRVTLNLEKINISELLKENLFQYFELFEEKNLALSVNIEEDCQITADQTVLQRIFQNCIGNMAKYGYRSGTVMLAQTTEELALTFENKLKAPIKNKEQLLGRFQTEDSSRTNKSTGLGLHIVQELSRLINGKIFLDISDERFSIQLKIKRG